MPVPFWRQKLSTLIDEIDPQEVSDAQRAAGEHVAEIIPELPYTEKEWEWVVLNKHGKRGQIKPESLKRMRNEDLEFLAGGGLGFEPEMAEIDAEIAALKRVSSEGGEDTELTPAEQERLKLEQRQTELGEARKINENAVRARTVLDHRSRMRLTFVSVVLAAFIGVIASWAVNDLGDKESDAPSSPTTTTRVTTTTTTVPGG